MAVCFNGGCWKQWDGVCHPLLESSFLPQSVCHWGSRIIIIMQSAVCSVGEVTAKLYFVSCFKLCIIWCTVHVAAVKLPYWKSVLWILVLYNYDIKVGIMTYHVLFMIKSWNLQKSWNSPEMRKC